MEVKIKTVIRIAGNVAVSRELKASVAIVVELVILDTHRPAANVSYH